MIQRYSDLAANERTFLAWVRTAIAITAFGFLVEKFDLFLAIAGKSLGGPAPSMIGQVVGNVAGLLLILLGGAVMVMAAIRFRRTAMDSIVPKTFRRPARVSTSRWQGFSRCWAAPCSSTGPLR